jgi:YaiO family outer membrane protein
VIPSLRRGLRELLLVWLLVLAPGAWAQDPPPTADQPAAAPATVPPLAPTAARISGWSEVGFNFYELTGGEPDWFGQYLRGVVDVANRDVWYYEVVNARRFGDDGVFFGIGNTHVFNEDWYSTVNVGTSAGGVFWPQFRADAFISRKWLARRELVTTLGVGYYDAKDVHYDVSGFLGFAYYFTTPWIVEGGLRYNISFPGLVTAPGPFVAVTYGRNKAYYVTGRFGFGREAYQVVGENEALVDFASQVVTLTWRHWVTRDWGFRLSAEYYHNPNYERAGFELGIFRDF